MAGRGRGIGADDQWWKKAIRKAVMDKGPDGIRKIQRIAEALVEQAIAGDVLAAKEIGDRLDGKAKQPVEISGDVTSYVVRAPEFVPDADEWANQHAPKTIQ